MSSLEDNLTREDAATGSTTGGLAAYHSLGIILAGGGAKGAYQAGALKAIYRFLQQHGALGKVRMIAGTSIGAWNAMFWLAEP
jgi:predicted acylesterase/phospholipase RssA